MPPPGSPQFVAYVVGYGASVVETEDSEAFSRQPSPDGSVLHIQEIESRVEITSTG